MSTFYSPGAYGYTDDSALKCPKCGTLLGK
jgi:hypothetical protein